jgi:hypothetical protein
MVISAVQITNRKHARMVVCAALREKEFQEFELKAELIYYLVMCVLDLVALAVVQEHVMQARPAVQMDQVAQILDILAAVNMNAPRMSNAVPGKHIKKAN